MASIHITAVRRLSSTLVCGRSRFPKRGMLWLETDGFTLLDNLITLCIMMFTMLALVGLLGAVISANATSKKHTVAMGLVELKLAETRRLGYNGFLSSDLEVTENYFPGANSIAAYPTYKRVTRTKVNTPTAGMQTVTVTVYWDQDKRLVSKSVQMAP